MLPVEFLHQAILAAGGLALAIPIALHLWTHRQPTRVIFPALRFLQKQQQQTHRRLQVRHWLLLMLRCLILGLFALLLARPRIATNGHGLVLLGGMIACLCLAAGGLAALLLWGERRGRAMLVGIAAASVAGLLAITFLWGFGSQQGILWRDQEESVAAVLVFDTAPHMAYEHESQTRLQQAQQMAEALLAQFPRGSEIGIVDTHGPVGTLSAERQNAVQTVRNLRIVPQSHPLRELIPHALNLLESSQLKAKELYLFSDLTAPAWDTTNPSLWQPLRTRTRDISVQVLDVGVTEPHNVGLGEIQISPPTSVVGEMVQMATTLQQLGPDRDVLVELALQVSQADLPAVVDGQVRQGEWVRRDLRTVSLPENGSAGVQFEIQGLAPGLHHGVIRLSDLKDGLALDNERFFTLRVGSSQRILLASWDDSMREVTEQLLSTLGFVAEVIEPSQLESFDLATSDVICLLDPPPLPSNAWRRALEFVQQGGGMAIALGPQSRPPDTFSSTAALELLPAPLVRVWNSVQPLALQPTDYTHPILRALEPSRATIAWKAFPVFQHWYLGTLHTNCHVIATFDQGQPAVIDRAVGKGHVVTYTTPWGQQQQDPEHASWNRLLRAETDDWPPFALILETFRYLADPQTTTFNYEVGDSVRMAWKQAPADTGYQLFTPDNTWQSITAEKDGSVPIPFAETPGTYYLKAASPAIPPAGFSLNFTPTSTQLQRSPPETLQAELELTDWQFSQRIDQLRREVRLRGSYEVYAPLLILLAIGLALEHVAANRFYAQRENQASGGGSV